MRLAKHLWKAALCAGLAASAPHAAMAEDSIVATTCALPAGQTMCTLNIRWQSSSKEAMVYVVDPMTGDARLWAANGTSGDQDWPYAVQWPGQEFEVRVNGVATARTRVWGKRMQKAALAGGMNYFYYDIDYAQSTEGQWVPYTAMEGLGHFVPGETVMNQLIEMHEAGARTLRIPVWFLDEGRMGTPPNDYACGPDPAPSDPVSKRGASGGLEAACRTNLAKLLNYAQQIGYEHVIVGLFPQWRNDPWSCELSEPKRWQELADQNYRVIADLRAIARASGLKYMIDLGNEGIPQTGRPACHFDYVRATWNRYAADFGTMDTVGFSIAVDSTWTAQHRYGQIASVYGSRTPTAIDVHVYGDGSNGNTDAAIFSALLAQQSALPAKYRALPWIVGEAFFNDAAAAQAFANGAASKEILFINHWPLARSPRRMVPPASFPLFDAYRQRGF